MSRGPAVITGRGVLSPLGNGWPSFAEAIREGRTAPVASFPSTLPDDPVAYHPIAEGAGIDSHGRDPLAAMATAAIAQGLAEAGIETGQGPLDDVGLVMNTGFGPSQALEAHLEQLWSKGPLAARPALFVETLLSMPAGKAAISLGLRGSSGAINAGDPFQLALDWIRAGRERTVVAGGADCLSAKTLRHHRRLASESGSERALLAQGAAFVALEDAASAAGRGAATYGELLGCGAASLPQAVNLPWPTGDAHDAFVHSMAGALRDAGLEPEAIAGVCLASADEASQADERRALEAVFGAQTPATLSPKTLLGEALGASGALGLLAALGWAECGRFEGSPSILVNTFELGGSISTLVVRPTEAQA
jgi:3-oxoacyl-(acyl-carrier-protein) synthase